VNLNKIPGFSKSSKSHLNEEQNEIMLISLVFKNDFKKTGKTFLKINI